MNSEATIQRMDPNEVSEVAQQFVLCYYNMMNESPQQLHRFYQEDSALIYEDAAVFGQKSIHDKFMNLNLHNSSVRVHVLQLDALKAGDKIVIQVAGEMSANDCEWRRFMQTFVLGEVSSNNFFVMNDIFRFQDRVFADNHMKTASNLPKVPEQTVYLPSKVEPKAPVENTTMAQFEKQPAVKPQPQARQQQQQPVVQHNGVDHTSDMLAVGHHKPHSKPQHQHEPKQAPVKSQQSQQQNQAVESEPTTPKSWAQMASTAANGRARPSEPAREQSQETTELQAPHRASERGYSGGGRGARPMRQERGGGGSRNAYRGQQQGQPIAAVGSGRRN